MSKQHLVLGLGSNLGLSIDYLRIALKQLKKSSKIAPIKISSIYESDALLPENADVSWNKKFLNAAVLCQFEGTAESILQEIKTIEVEMGRKPADRWAPRLIDIDILAWSLDDFHSEKISIPHQQLLNRPFALLPLLQIAPALIKDTELPEWAHDWVSVKPFNTKKSAQFFWPQLVGILNITEDSFSDGGEALTEKNILLKANKLLTSGADILDIGAESTRPNASVVSAEVELQRLDLTLKCLTKEFKNLRISLDCRHFNVARSILEKYNIEFLNDVEGFVDPQMAQLLVQSKAKAVVMHSLSVPPKAEQVIPLNSDPISILSDWWSTKLQQLEILGVDSDRLIFDPGIGFGKTAEQSLYILKNLKKFSSIKSDIYIAHSRKSYQKIFSDSEASGRDLETALVTAQLDINFVQYLRVHDIETQKTALRFS